MNNNSTHNNKFRHEHHLMILLLKCMPTHTVVLPGKPSERHTAGERMATEWAKVPRTAGRSISEQRETPNGKLWVEQPSTAWDETTSPRTYTSREDLTWTCHRHLSYIVTVLNHVLQGLEWAKVPVCHIEDHRKRTIYCLVQCFTLWSKRGNVSLWNLTLHCSLDTCEWSCRDGTALRSPTSSALLWTGKHSCVISDT